PRWPSGKGSALETVRNPIPLKIRCVWDLLHGKSCVVDTSSRWCDVEVSRGGTSSDVVLVPERDPSQNSPRVSSKRDVDVTKLNQNITPPLEESFISPSDFKFSVD
ncbi:hypothetical protein AVEN_101729-1, partial [Araneus ventricosus]